MMCLNGGGSQRNGMKVMMETLPEQKPKEENKEKRQWVYIHKPPEQEEECLDGCIQYPAQDNTIRPTQDTPVPNSKKP